MVTPPVDDTERRGGWFGEMSFLFAGVGGFVNVTTLFTMAFGYFLLLLWYLAELVLIAILWAIGGRARQAGTGLAVTFVSVLAIALALMAATWFRDHLLR
ncbi:hypothetical protein JMUB6875_15020 [Nocardia sp. JMUB6875]|uniref:hypothetical protein n=1 Tax=Nocardia sp. JMUB6875 TaxID=3158170 RepID=UPI0032E54D81